jgi:sulfide:quinone oxidoreductase
MTGASRAARIGGMSGRQPLHVVVAGGGIAGLEALLTLDELAGPRVSLTLIEPREELVLHALEPAAPFGAGEAGRLAIDDIAGATRTDVVRSPIERVDPATRTVITRNGERVHYDALVVTVGARRVVAVPRALTWLPGASHTEFTAMLDALATGSVRNIAFVVPARCSWPLPAYELALMTARRARRLAPHAQVRLITPEPTPLSIFGVLGSATVARELEAARVRFTGNAIANVTGDDERVVEVWPEKRRFAVDRVVALPRSCGPEIAGLDADIEGFLLTDAQCRVRGATDVWAAGEATVHRPMNGGLASLEADFVAEQVAVRAGAEVPTGSDRPVLRAQLRTGRASLWLQRDLSDPLDHGAAAREPLWSPPGKIAARRLGAFLAERDVPGGLRVVAGRPAVPA